MAEELLLFNEGLCSMKLVSHLLNYVQFYKQQNPYTVIIQCDLYRYPNTNLYIQGDTQKTGTFEKPNKN